MTAITVRRIPGTELSTVWDEIDHEARQRLSGVFRIEPATPLTTNREAREGCDRCACGCKYWKGDRCIDCGEHVSKAPRDDEDGAR